MSPATPMRVVSPSPESGDKGLSRGHSAHRHAPGSWSPGKLDHVGRGQQDDAVTLPEAPRAGSSFPALQGAPPPHLGTRAAAVRGAGQGQDCTPGPS